MPVDLSHLPMFSSLYSARPVEKCSITTNFGYGRHVKEVVTCGRIGTDLGQCLLYLSHGTDNEGEDQWELYSIPIQWIEYMPRGKAVTTGQYPYPWRNCTNVDTHLRMVH